MPIKIEHLGGGLYRAAVSPPHGNGSSWTTPQPLRSGELIDELRGLGCHQTDIGDAFSEADPDWLSR